MAEYKLITEILKLSDAAAWENAKWEWSLADVFESDPETCLCGHFPIRELCVLRNVRNGFTTTVGNICVKKFLGLPSDEIFKAVKRIRKDPSRSLTEAAVAHAYANGWITQWEENFYRNIMGKRKLTDKQVEMKVKVNNLFLERMKRPNTRTK